MSLNIPYIVDKSTTPWTIVFSRYMVVNHRQIEAGVFYPKIHFPFMTEYRGVGRAVYKARGITPDCYIYKFDARSVRGLEGNYRVLDNGKYFFQHLKGSKK